jgi:endonuclease/exonuclease/phosphatase family metal-dependent hydrolase
MVSQLRLATFNLENLDWSPRQDADFERRLGVLKPMLNECAADILCLQEVNAQRAASHDERRFLALDRLLAGGPYEAYHRATSVRPGARAPADVHNLVIASRWPIAEQRQVFHDIVAKWRWTPPTEGRAPPSPIEITWDRPLLYARISAPDGKPLHIVNLHLRAPRAVPFPGDGTATTGDVSRAYVEGQFVAGQKREGQALEARLFVERLFDAETRARIIVCGDLNSQEHDMPARILRGGRDEETPETAPRLLASLTECVSAARRFSVVHGDRNILLDHILASPALACACSSVVIFNEGLQDEVTAQEPIFGSLHAPIVASFDFSSDQSEGLSSG